MVCLVKKGEGMGMARFHRTPWASLTAKAEIDPKCDRCSEGRAEKPTPGYGYICKRCYGEVKDTLPKTR